MHSGALASGDRYDNTIRFPFPYGFQTSIFWHLVIDINSRLDTEVFESSLSSTEVLINALPDLKFGMLDTSATLSTPSGQPYDLLLPVQNIGTAPVRASAKWYLAVYLSTDALVDPFDVRLTTTAVRGAIDLNVTVEKQLSMFMPFDLPTMTYYLIVGK